MLKPLKITLFFT